MESIEIGSSLTMVNFCFLVSLKSEDMIDHNNLNWFDTLFAKLSLANKVQSKLITLELYRLAIPQGLWVVELGLLYARGPA